MTPSVPHPIPRPRHNLGHPQLSTRCPTPYRGRLSRARQAARPQLPAICSLPSRAEAREAFASAMRRGPADVAGRRLGVKRRAASHSRQIQGADPRQRDPRGFSLQQLIKELKPFDTSELVL